MNILHSEISIVTAGFDTFRNCFDMLVFVPQMPGILNPGLKCLLPSHFEICESTMYAKVPKTEDDGEDGAENDKVSSENRFSKLSKRLIWWLNFVSQFWCCILFYAQLLQSSILYHHTEWNVCSVYVHCTFSIVSYSFDRTFNASLSTNIGNEHRTFYVHICIFVRMCKNVIQIEFGYGVQP